ncbi:glucosamine-6-phosphate deaminase [Cetobacterium sp.]|uniref:glucosamine-6-phosphate deaminase n=1 Tax=Cetobacterium sp. TaxID=2071632 RepID=UPI003F37FC52
MRLLIPENNIGDWAAAYVVKKIKEFKPTQEKPFVLGLPTGSTPEKMYKKLVQLYKEGVISFENVITFNMDEYVGLGPDDEQSYHRYMHDHFFNHVDVKKENINILNGLADDLKVEAQRYEDKIKSVGGIHLFVGGIGPDGHLAFNEPGSSLSSRTRDKELTQDTIIANSRFFDGDLNKVPKLAMTVGVATVLDSEEVMILVDTHAKALALHKAVECGINHMWTVSALQMHRRGIVVAAEQACGELKVSTYRYFKDIEKDNLDTEKFLESVR